MHEAYKVTQLLQQNVQIESVAAYGKFVCIQIQGRVFSFCSFFLDKTLLLGTRQGYLLMYNVVTRSDDKIDVELMTYNKNFSKKPVVQIQVIPEYRLLVSLTGVWFKTTVLYNTEHINVIFAIFCMLYLILDNVISVHDINSSQNFPLIHQAAKTRGATLFTLDIQVSF